jgi:hypothetical protein
VIAGCAIDLDEIATPEILDPRQVQGLHSDLCSWNVRGMLARFVEECSRASSTNAATWPPMCGHRASFCALLFLANRAN